MKRRLRLFGIAGGVLAVAAVALVTVARSDWLREHVRQKIVDSLASATGGSVEIAQFDYNWAALRAEVHGVVVRGTEAPPQLPLFTAGRVELAIDVRSWIGRDVELRELVVEKPQVHVYVNADGTTNIPGAERKTGRGPIENLLDLEIARLRITDGLVEYDSRKVPLNVRAEGLRTVMEYRRHPQRYEVQLHTDKLSANGFAEGALDLDAVLHRNRADFNARVALAGGESSIQAKGALEDFKNPRVSADYEVRAAAADLKVKMLKAGVLQSKGNAMWSGDGIYRVSGTFEGQGVTLEGEHFQLQNLKGRGQLRLTPELLQVDDLRADGSAGSLDGEFSLEGWKRMKASGQIKSTLSLLLAAAKVEKPAWDGQVESPFEFSGEAGAAGLTNSVLTVRAALTPLPEHLPAEGNISARWDQRSGEIRIEPSSLRLPTLTMHAEGTLGRTLTFGLVATDVSRLAPYLTALGLGPIEIPVGLDHGQIRAEGVVTGPLSDPTFDGNLEAERATFKEILIDHAQIRFLVSKNELNLPQVTLSQAGSATSGALRINLNEWKADSRSGLAARATLKSIDLHQIGSLTQSGVALSGRLDATVNVGGTLGDPQGSMRFSSANATVAGETLRRLTGEVRNTDATHISLVSAFELAGAKASLNGIYSHVPGEWRQGSAELQVKSSALNAAQLAAVSKFRPEFGAGLTLDVKVRADVKGSEIVARSVDGTLEADGIRDREIPLGTLRLRTSTSDDTVRVIIDGQMDQSPIAGTATVRLNSNYPSAAELEAKGVSLSFLTSALSSPNGEKGKLRFDPEGTLDAMVRWRGTLRNLKAGSAQVTVPRLEVRPHSGSDEFTLRNAGALQFDIDSNGVQVRSARLAAKETVLTLAGVYSFSARNPWDLSLSGMMNLGVLNSFDPDLTATGNARMNANLRGTAENPTVSGRMAIEKASFYLKGIPNGIENASGSIDFDQARASIETLTGSTGGGTFNLTGFVGFGKGELSYRLQANAQDVRVRYPEGVSTTLDAALSLTGSSYASLLSGVVTIEKSGFRSSGDFGSLIAGTANPIPVPASQNTFLRNLQFDVRVRSSPNATFQTDYTQDIQTEADLRVRGSPAKPVVLGTIKVNQGEVNFFGNRYTISGGEFLFFSTVAIQPSINLDLETRIRGVTVYINVNGPMNKLNINYRSEPPLQSNEILALLTVGRAPTSTSGNLPTTPNTVSGANSPLSDASNTLLGGALSASVSSRVERFFGASRIKIDPNMTGVENVPQARLTIEQSLSRDMTLTYSTNLSRSSQQIVRLEVDLSRQWSFIAVRDENGTFGIDFLFRRRFK